jgi:hypothetical protein
MKQQGNLNTTVPWKELNAASLYLRVVSMTIDVNAS